MKQSLLSVLLSALVLTLFHGTIFAEGKGVKIVEKDNILRVEIDGRLFTEYHYKNVIRPFFYPVIGPTGENMTRNWPMKEAPDEEKDHPHHRGLWFTHGDVNGLDFWADGKGTKIRHDKFIKLESGDVTGIIQSSSTWLSADEKTVCTDTRTHRFYTSTDNKSLIMDMEISIHASNGQVVLGDTKEGSMAIRLVPTMRVKGKVAKGHILNSNGDKDGETWGKSAAWCDYYGPIGSETVGVAIFDNPLNPRHPTWWHVRDYGLFAANPFGVHYFEKKPAKSGDLTIPSGETVTFRYRFYFHKGNTEDADISGHYTEYKNSIKKD